MNTALRPLSLGELLDRTFSLYRRNFLLFIGISMVPAALILAVSLGKMIMLREMQAGTPDSAAVRTTFGITGILLISAYFFGSAISQAAAVRVVSAVHLGREITIKQAFSKQRYGRVLRVIFSAGVRAGGPLVIAILLFVGFSASLAGLRGSVLPTILLSVVFLVGIIAAVLWSVRLTVRYAVAVAACVVENLKSRVALRRSSVLMKGSGKRVLTIFLLGGIIRLALGGGVVIFVRIATMVFHRPSVSLLVTILSLTVNFFASALAGPVGVIAVGLLYYDERVRKEAFDIEHMMMEMGMNQGETVSPPMPAAIIG